MKKLFYVLPAMLLLMASCVSMKEYETQTALKGKYLTQKKDCEEELNTTENKLADTQAKLAQESAEKQRMQDEVEKLKLSSKNMSELAAEERALKEKTTEEYEKYMQSSSKKQENLIKDLAEKERVLNKRESDLHNIKVSLEEREAQLKDIKKEIFEKESILEIKSKKIAELEAKLNAQSQAMSNLKTNISKALKEFTSEELTVEEKEGKIYVSLSEKLLFKPGSFTLDKNGKNAIAKLAAVLQKQEDVDIIVEGHADADPFGGKGELVDNLDLSTKRATSVTRVLIENQVPKEKIVAAGRGDAKPVADNKTAEGKAKNRRTEIILSPNLEKLFQLIQSN